ncbi:Fic family protein [Fusobacterium sp. PH5-44]|uniref:Fic family protein n=1 Tax=unclassified Fusobacterium TaxID=2648384 RepID=UPI003D22BBB9
MTDKYRMTVKENIFLAKRNIVDYIWKSANLEGIAVTYPQTEVIFDGLAVEGMQIKDINAIVNLKRAWEFIFDNIDYPVDLNYVSKINQIIGEANVIQNAGKLRESEVRMGGTEWKPEIPQKEKIENEMKKINIIESSTDKATTMMLYLMRTQAFYDGNKRTSMLVANQLMIQNGAGIISIPIKEQEKFRELLINFYETNDMKEIKKFVNDKCVDGIDFKENKKI